MRQIYINTMLGTTRIDYNPNDDTDIIIVATTCTVSAVHRAPIEATGIQPGDIDIFDKASGRLMPLSSPIWEEERRMALYSDEGPNEKYLRDLMGDDAYENFEIQ